MHGVHAQCRRHREKDRCHDEHNRSGIHEIAGGEQHDVGDEKKSHDAEALRRHPLGHGLWDLLGGEQPGEHCGIGDDVEDHRAHGCRLEQHGGHVGELELLVHEHRDEEGVDRGDGGGFRRREQARIDAAEHEQDEEQSPEALAKRAPALAPAGAGHARIIVAPGAIPRRRAQHGGKHQPGHDAGDEELTHRSRIHHRAGRASRLHAAGRNREDDEIDRGRKQDAERARGRDHAGAEARRISLFQQSGQDDRADAHHGRDR